jgi:Uri superfamily endonuclease
MNSKPGTYALVLRGDASTYIDVGRWGRLNVRPGYYIYVGSAFGPGGVVARVSRHCRETGNKHWHIDYLRESANVTSVWYSHSPVRLEHRWADALARMNATKPVKGFGCSDCKCESHLFFVAQKPRLAEFADAVRGAVKSWSCV